MINQVSRSCPASSIVDLHHVLTKLTNGIISRVTLGKKYGDEFLDIVREYVALLGAFCVGDFFPWHEWIDVLTGLDGRSKRASHAMDAFLERVIKEHQERKEIDGRDGDDQRDFVDMLLHLREGSKLGVELERDSIKAMILDMFVAVTQTTAISMEWAMAEIIRNPEVLQKAQEEETLCLHPVGPLLIPRESNTNVVLQDYYIPPKTIVIINAWAISRDPLLWENPEEFIPERFTNSPIDFKGHHFQYIPFGARRRVCPRISFAILTMELALANLLYFFDWKLPDGANGKDLDMSEAGGMTVSLRSPLHLIPICHVF
ncbi:hypothetical protein AAC387_Pa12g0939 [Persea americana]